MGFPHDKATHHFRRITDGGAIEVVANDSKDSANCGSDSVAPKAYRDDVWRWRPLRTYIHTRWCAALCNDYEADEVSNPLRL
jgi:hypothetical protein